MSFPFDKQLEETAKLLTDEQMAEITRSSFFLFLVDFWDIIIHEEPVFNWHIKTLCDELQELSKSIVARKPKPYDLIINIPPGTTKTTIVTVMFPAWLWTQDPTLRIISNSYSGKLSVEAAVKSKDIINSEQYQVYFPEVRIRRDKAGKEDYENTRGGTRNTSSTTGAVLGRHAHLIINDDPVNPNQALSDVMRKTANEHTKTLSSRKVNKENTPVITIMQRLHQGDVSGYLLGRKKDNIKHICLPAIVTKDVNPPELKEFYIDGMLDPVRLGPNAIAEARIDLGTRGFSAQWLQAPSDEEGDIVKKAWFRKIDRAEFNRVRPGPHSPIVFFMDTAYGDKNDDGDPTGIIATCKIGNYLYISHAEKIFKRFPDLIRYIPIYANGHGYDRNSTIRIEPKANGLSVIHQLQDGTALNVTKTITPKDSKETRLNAVSPTIESGRVFLVEDAWNEDFIDEICGFPNKMNDEYVDLIYYAIEYHIGTSGHAQDLAGLFR